MPARAIWEGSIGFGMAHIPVRLMTATRDNDIKFKRWHPETESFPRQVQLVANGEPDEEGFQPAREASLSEMTRVFVQPDGDKVEITDEDLGRIQMASSRHMRISGFVPKEDINPLFIEKTYWLVPALNNENAQYAYGVFVGALRASGRAAIVNVLMRTKEHLACIHVVSGCLCLSIMYYDDEIVWGNSQYYGDMFVEPSDVEAATTMVNSMSVGFEHDAYYDSYRDRVLSLITNKFDQQLDPAQPDYEYIETVPEAPNEPIQETLARELASLSR